MDFILENGLNKFISSGKQFEIKENGEILLVNTKTPTINDKSKKESSKEISNIGTPNDTIATKETSQKTSDSVFIKDCFKSVSKEDLAEVRKWIADFESNGD